MLDLRGKLAVVVGAGPVGLRKVDGLREVGARVLLVDREAPGEALPEGVEVRAEAYRAEFLAGAALVFACTDQPDLNARIAADARAAGAMANVADVPDQCDFYAASVVRDGDVVLAVGSGGASPGLAAWLRRRIAGQLPPRVGEFAAVLEGLRADVRDALPDDSPRRMRLMKQLVSDEAYEDFLAGGPQAVRDRFHRLLKGAKD
jgi:siroheme synthase-like protein